MTSHVYNTRNNPLSTIEKNVSSEANFEASESFVISETANLIFSLEKKLISRFDGLDKEILNLKDIIIKNIQDENQRLRKKVSDLESKVISLENDHNSLKQYGRRNNLEISGILDTVPDQNLEQKVTEILDEIDVSVSPNDIEACHRMGSSVNNSRRIIVRFTNRKFATKAFLNRSKLRKVPSTSLNYNIFVNENLILRYRKIAFLCRKLKRADHIEKTFTRDGIVHISSPDIQRGKVLKIYHLNDLFNLFPDHDFGENIREDKQNDSIQSSY